MTYEQRVRHNAHGTLWALAKAIGDGNSKDYILTAFCSGPYNPVIKACLRLLIETVFHDIDHGSEHNL